MNDEWFTVEKIDSNTYAISEYGHWERAHAYLIIGNERAALIDTGLGIDNMKRVTDRLTPLSIIVLTTHVHWDHIGSHGAYDQFYVHEKEKGWIENGIPGLTIEQIRKAVVRDLAKSVPAAFNSGTYTLFHGKPAGLFHGGDIFDLGGRRLEVIDTPGHSPGHVCFYDDKNGYLFSGDLIYSGTPIYASYPSTDPALLVESFKKVARLEHNVSRVYGGHNELGLDPTILHEAGEDADYLIHNDLVKFGTGLHRFQQLSVLF